MKTAPPLNTFEFFKHCNFEAPEPEGTWTGSTFLEASNLALFGASWLWGWQDFRPQKP